MVNYLYKLGDIEANHEAYARKGRVTISDGVKRSLRKPRDARHRSRQRALAAAASFGSHGPAADDREGRERAQQTQAPEGEPRRPDRSSRRRRPAPRRTQAGSRNRRRTRERSRAPSPPRAAPRRDLDQPCGERRRIRHHCGVAGHEQERREPPRAAAGESGQPRERRGGERGGEDKAAAPDAHGDLVAQYARGLNEQVDQRRDGRRRKRTCRSGSSA